ncbi:MAG: hypothetical protein AAB462_01620 [Patescibacteria group bacterium]
MKTTQRAKIFLASLLAVVTLVGSPLAVYAGYAPSSRATFQCITPTNCPGANYVTFNSFTNAPNYGDERAFFDGKDAGITGAGGYQDSINVRDGQRIVLRTYIHNNANPAAIGEAAATAKNTRMQVLLPTSKKTTNTAASMISADNANPGTVSDTVDFTGGSPFTLAFDTSAPVQVTYRPNGTGDYVTRTVSSAAFTNASTLNATFGDWKGCFNYGALVTTTIVVKMDEQPPVTPAYTCDAFNIVADVNRNVKASEFRTTATNGAVFKNAVINWGDNSPELTTNNVVGQSHQYKADGTYTITTTAYFTVDGKVVSAGGPQCAKQVTFTSGKPPVVTPPTTPGTPTTLVNTGAGSVAAIFAAATAAGAVAYRTVLARRLTRQ